MTRYGEIPGAGRGIDRQGLSTGWRKTDQGVGHGIEIAVCQRTLERCAASQMGCAALVDVRIIESADRVERPGPGGAGNVGIKVQTRQHLVQQNRITHDVAGTDALADVVEGKW